EGARGDSTSGGTAAKIVAMKLPCNAYRITSWAFVSFVTLWFAGGQITTAIVQAVAQQTASRTRAHVETLASERFEGRLAGSAGERLAGDYIASQLKKIGAKPLPGQTDSFLPFEFTAGTRDGGSTIEVRG